MSDLKEKAKLGNWHVQSKTGGGQPPPAGRWTAGWTLSLCSLICSLRVKLSLFHKKGESESESENDSDQQSENESESENDSDQQSQQVKVKVKVNK